MSRQALSPLPPTSAESIGVLGGSGTFGINSTELSHITAGNLIIGGTGLGGGLTTGTAWNIGGTAGTTAGAYNLTLNNAGNINTSAGTITLGSNNLTMNAGTVTLGSITGNSSSSVSLLPSIAESIGVGGAGGTFNISAANLAAMTTGIVNIGNTSITGGLTVYGNLNLTGTAGSTAGAYTLNLSDGGNITSNGNTLTEGGNVINLNALGNVNMTTPSNAKYCPRKYHRK